MSVKKKIQSYPLSFIYYIMYNTNYERSVIIKH